MILATVLSVIALGTFLTVKYLSFVYSEIENGENIRMMRLTRELDRIGEEY